MRVHGILPALRQAARKRQVNHLVAFGPVVVDARQRQRRAFGLRRNRQDRRRPVILTAPRRALRADLQRYRCRRGHAHIHRHRRRASVLHQFAVRTFGNPDRVPVRTNRHAHHIARIHQIPRPVTDVDPHVNVLVDFRKFQIVKGGHFNLDHPRIHPRGNRHPARRGGTCRAARRRNLLARSLVHPVNRLGENKVVARPVLRRRAFVENNLNRLLFPKIPARNHPGNRRRRRTVPGIAGLGDKRLFRLHQAHRKVKSLLVQYPLLARDRLKEARLRQASASPCRLKTGHRELERQARVPAGVKRVAAVLFISALQKHARANLKARRNLKGRMPVRLLPLPAFEPPNAQTRVQLDARPRKLQTQVRTLKRLFHIVGPCPAAPVVEGMVVVHRRVEKIALQVQTETEPLVALLEIAVEKHGTAHDDIGRELAAIHNPKVAVKAVLLLKTGPEHHAGLQKQRLARHARIRARPQRHNRVQFARDILSPNPADARIQAEVLVGQRNASRTDGILNGIDQHARARVAEGLFAAFGIIARCPGRNGPAVCAFKAAGITETVPDSERFIAFRATEHAAPKAFELLGRAHKEGLVRLRGRRQGDNRQQQERSRRQQKRPQDSTLSG